MKMKMTYLAALLLNQDHKTLKHKTLNRPEAPHLYGDNVNIAVDI